MRGRLLLSFRAAQNRQQDGAKAGQQSPYQQGAAKENQTRRKVESKVVSLSDKIVGELDISHVGYPPGFALCLEKDFAGKHRPNSALLGEGRRLGGSTPL
jgi:hypothetical protein